MIDERKYIGLGDKDGHMIRVRDIVEFRFCADHGSFSMDEEDCGCATRMVDEVIEDDGKFYFSCPGIGGAFAWRFHDKCRVIGSLPDDAEMFWAANTGLCQDAPKESQ